MAEAFREIGRPAAMALLVMLAAACTGGAERGTKREFGGCAIDTVAIGTAIERGASAPERLARIEILSIDFAGRATYRGTAGELTSLLDTLGFEVFERSELIRVRKGPCWPPYRVIIYFRAADSASTAPLRSALLARPLAGRSAHAERPEGYGEFFITCGIGDMDWWSLWYTGK